MKIDATAKTPQVEYFESTGILEISGKSIPENTIKFYQTISDWLTSFSTNHANKKIELIFKLEYFNTSSAKKILELMKIIQQMVDNGNHQASVTWMYEESDLDMQEAGEDFMKLLHIPFKFESFQED
jgi:hypothetical protein